MTRTDDDITIPPCPIHGNAGYWTGNSWDPVRHAVCGAPVKVDGGWNALCHKVLLTREAEEHIEP